MKLSQIDVSFIEQRTGRMKERRSEFISRADEYEAIYLMDLWTDDEEVDQPRLVAPTAWTRVEAYKSILLTKPPVISVPPSDVKAVAEDRADVIEKFLQAAWYQADVTQALNDAEWFACTFGEGVLRCLYDDNACEGDFPLLIQGDIDPRNIYALPSARPGLDAELAHAYKATRREIEEEWSELPGHPDDSSEAAWLDEEIDFVDYWRVDTVTETVEEETEPKEKPAGAVAGLVEVAETFECECVECGYRMPSDTHCADTPCPECGGQMRRVERPGAGRTSAAEEPEEKPRKKKVKRRVVTNAVVADGEFLKKPVRMPGYNRIPFIRYAGISTPLKDENGALSVLFPITGGSGIGSSDVKGMVAAMCELLSYRQRIVEMFANGATVVTGADRDVTLDFGPGAQNSLPEGAKVDFLMPPGPHPAVDGQLQVLNKEIEDATISATMMGRYVGDMSGIALSAMNNPVLMKIAHRQQSRERAYQALNQLILSLTEFYSGPDGWSVWSPGRVGMIDLVITPDDINGYYRNQVKLSASLPKDVGGEIMVLANLVNQSLISRETFLDQLQQIKDLARQSPLDEMKATLRDKMLFSDETGKALAKLIVQEYSMELAEILGIGPEPEVSAAEVPQGPPPMGPGPTPPGPMGPGPMQGIPPGVVPPIPEMVGTQNLPGMLEMQGNPVPQAPTPGGEEA